jgi:hypothetical protein
MKSTLIGGCGMRIGKSIFALITTATTATWAAMIASSAFGDGFLTAVTGRFAA